MTLTASAKTSSPISVAKAFGLLLLTLFFLSLAACGGTKVYTIDKTIVYNNNLYNVSNVQRIGSRVEGELPNGDVINMRAMEKKEIQALLKQNETILITAVIELDDQDLVYRRGRIDSYRDYSSVMKSFERALNDISKFMADKNKTQLKLK